MAAVSAARWARPLRGYEEDVFAKSSPELAIYDDALNQDLY